MDQILSEKLKEYFKEEFSGAILKKLKTGHKLSKFNINPFVLIALSSGVFGEATSLNMAKALLYPRVFGTSVSTTFGDKMQNLCVKYLGAKASSTQGMDIEFDDKIDNKRIIMQLKAGPNTINSKDVEPILREMGTAYRLIQRNGGSGDIPTFAIGITYGVMADISGHYKKIHTTGLGAQPEIPILIGQDFWHRLTGNHNFYTEMIAIFADLFEEVDYSSLLERDLEMLAVEIEKKYFTAGKFDKDKI